jgi:excisionase family DNA binding protein
MTATSDRLALRAPEAAAALGISLRSLMTLVKAGDVPFVRIGERSLRFPRAALERWLESKVNMDGSADGRARTPA